MGRATMLRVYAGLAVLGLTAVSAGADAVAPLGHAFHTRLHGLLRVGDPGARREFRSAASGREGAVAAALGADLRHPETTVRTAAALGLGWLGRRADAPMLADALRDESEPSTRLALVGALGRLGGEAARRALTDALDQDPVLDVRLASVDALLATGHPATPAILATRSQGAGPLADAVRSACARLRLTPADVGMLAAPDGPTPPADPAAAAGALQAAEDREAARTLVTGSAAAGRALADALAATGSGSAAEARLRRTMRLREFVQAGRAARQTDATAAAIPALVAACGDPAPAIRGEARRRLAACAGQDLGPDPQAWGRWWTAVRADFRRPAAEGTP